MIYNQAGWPAGATSRARLTAFFAEHGGYVGAGTGGTGFLTSAGQVAGLAAASRSGSRRSGIVYWDNVGGAASPIVGAYPARDTAIMDPPTWLTAVPASLTVDAKLPSLGFFAAGLWLQDAQSASAAGAPLIAHGPNSSGSARLIVFAMNPAYRADPEREWPALASAPYWVQQAPAVGTLAAEARARHSTSCPPASCSTTQRAPCRARPPCATGRWPRRSSPRDSRWATSRRCPTSPSEAPSPRRPTARATGTATSPPRSRRSSWSSPEASSWPTREGTTTSTAWSCRSARSERAGPMVGAPPGLPHGVHAQRW